jgi:hypothetical protein
MFGLSVAMQAPVALARDPRIDFHIPAQPLASALEEYGNVTGRNALYNSELTVGRRSMGVHGRLAPDAALSSLLEGTGLSASHVTPDSFVLLRAPPTAAVGPPGSVSQYYGRVQLSLQRSLCSDPAVRPGHYRIGLRLWIDAAGDLVRFTRVGSAGTSRLDAGIDRALGRIRIGAPPPAGLAQPLSIVIRPKAPGVTMGCDELSTRTGTLQ